MKLYWGPHACAIGIHILLEEIGEPYEREEIDVAAGATRQPPFLAINPKGKVPTLVRNDGTVLTEFNAIATWLARTHPQANLLPRDTEVEARAVEAMTYVDGIIDGQGYGRIFAPKMSVRLMAMTAHSPRSSSREEKLSRWDSGCSTDRSGSIRTPQA